MCFPALMFDVTGECYLPQGVTEARLKKQKHVQSSLFRTDVTYGFMKGNKPLRCERTSRIVSECVFV